MSLKLLTPPRIEPVGLTETKVFLKIDGEEEDQFLTQLIKTARQAVEAFTARSLIIQSWSLEVNIAYCIALSDANYLSGVRSRGDKGLELPRSPFVKLIDKPMLVDDYGRREISSYRLDTAGRVAKLHFSFVDSLFFEPQGSIVIHFSAGYGDTPEDVPEPLRHAVLMMVAELYEKRVGVVNDNQGLPPTLNQGAIALIKPYRHTRLL